MSAPEGRLGFLAPSPSMKYSTVGEGLAIFQAPISVMACAGERRASPGATIAARRYPFRPAVEISGEDARGRGPPGGSSL